MNSPQKRFDAAFRSWGERSPRTPPDEAARRVVAKLSERRVYGWSSSIPLRLATVTAGLALLLVVSWATLPEPPGAPPSQPDISLPPLSDDVVLLWLDDETPLYLTVAPPATKGGS